MSGVIALTIAILRFLGVLAFHSPEYLTTPQLRKRYDAAVIRNIMLVALAVAGGNSLVNILIHRVVGFVLLATNLLVHKFFGWCWRPSMCSGFQ